MALSFLKTIEKPDDLRKIECLLSHITANKKLCKKNTIKTQTSCLHISFFIQIFCVSLHLGIKATLFCKTVAHLACALNTSYKCLVLPDNHRFHHPKHRKRRTTTGIKPSFAGVKK